MQFLRTSNNTIVVFTSCQFQRLMSFHFQLTLSYSIQFKTVSFELFRTRTGPDVLGGRHRGAPAAGRLRPARPHRDARYASELSRMCFLSQSGSSMFNFMDVFHLSNSHIISVEVLACHMIMTISSRISQSSTTTVSADSFGLVERVMSTTRSI